MLSTLMELLLRWGKTVNMSTASIMNLTQGRQMSPWCRLDGKAPTWVVLVEQN